MTEDEKKKIAARSGVDMIRVAVDVICSRAEVGPLTALSLIFQMSLHMMARIDQHLATEFAGAVVDAARAESAAAEKQALQRQKDALTALNERSSKLAGQPWGSA